MTDAQLAKELDNFIGGQIYMDDGRIAVSVLMSGLKWQRIIAALNQSPRPNGEAFQILLELHKHMDFEVPMGPNEVWGVDDPSAINALYARAYALLNGSGGPSSPQWISVADRLPEPMKTVLGYRASRAWCFVELRRTKTTRWWDGGERDVTDVTHWMPLPESPPPATPSLERKP